MLLDGDVVTDGKAQPGAFTGRLCRKERAKQLLLDVRRYAGAVIAYPDFDAVAEVLGRDSERGLVIAGIGFRFTLGRRVEPVRKQIEQHPGDFLWEQVDLAGSRVKGPLQSDFK